jgi:hypothetical protein
VCGNQNIYFDFNYGILIIQNYGYRRIIAMVNSAAHRIQGVWDNGISGAPIIKNLLNDNKY